MRVHNHLRYGKSGQALVEFALIAPVLVLMLMGIFDLGRGVYSYGVVANAAREGARYGITHPMETAEIQNQAIAGAIALDHSQLDTPIVACSSSCESGNTLSVTIVYHFQPVTPMFPTIRMFGKSTMTIE